MTIYLSPKPQHFLNDPVHFGCIFNVAKQVGGQFEALELGCWWIFDNSRFTNQWSEPKWIRWLERLQPYRATCLGIVVPDRPFDREGTLADFERYGHIPRFYGYPTTFVTQNGMTVDDIPWSEIDCLFIGGDDDHKRGYEGQQLALEAKRRGLWVHVGRSQSGTAMLDHWTWADSLDGTTLVKHPTQQVESITAGVDYINAGTGHQLVLLPGVWSYRPGKAVI